MSANMHTVYPAKPHWQAGSFHELLRRTSMTKSPVSSVTQRVRLVAWAFTTLTMSSQAHADELRGTVVAISDGDTMTVLDASRRQHRVRLAAIDAPERRQAFGTKSRESLSAMAFRKDVVDFQKTDKYRRVLGRVLAAGQDVGLAQIRAGMAWHNVAYAKEQTPLNRIAYSEAESEARGLRRGLWSEPNPQPPWEFRHAGRIARTTNYRTN